MTNYVAFTEEQETQIKQAIERLQAILDAGIPIVPASDETAVDSQPINGRLLDIPPLSQRDPRWRQHSLGHDDGHNATIGSWGCLLVVQTMLARFWGLSDRLPSDENDYYVRNGGFNGKYMVSMSMSKVYDRVSHKGAGYLVYSRHGSRMHDNAKRRIMAGIPVVARVDFKPTTDPEESHFVLLVGFDPAEDDYIMVDPWIGKVDYVGQYYGLYGRSNVRECIYYDLDADE